MVLETYRPFRIQTLFIFQRVFGIYYLEDHFLVSENIQQVWPPLREDKEKVSSSNDHSGERSAEERFCFFATNTPVLKYIILSRNDKEHPTILDERTHTYTILSFSIFNDLSVRTAQVIPAAQRSER